MDRLVDLLNQIFETELELAELNENGGDLKERLEIAERIEDLKNEHFREKMRETGDED